MKKALKELTNSVLAYLSKLDEVMKEPEGNKRGKRVAVLSNALEMANDQARYFALGIDYRKDKKFKPTSL